MAFKFNLQKILEIRENSANQARLTLEDWLQKKTMLANLLSKERENYLNERNEMNQNICNCKFEIMGVFEKSLEDRKQKLMKILQVIREVESEVRHAEMNLAYAQKELKVIEKLKEKRFAEYQKIQADKEAKFIDEMATIKYTRTLWEQKKKQVKHS